MSTAQKRVPLQQAAADEGRRLAADPNVVSVGFGLKFVGGKPTLKAALHYYVRDKLASTDAIKRRGSAVVPREVEGYGTDVLPWTIARPSACPDAHRPTAERGSRREDPLVGGTSTAILGGFSTFVTHYGTLGGICFDANNNAAMAVSNAHVWGDDIGTEAIQPFPPFLDYVGGTIEWLACGGPLSHLFTWTAPSALTSILTGAAAAAWVAAAAADAEDPNRWGQRTGPVPASGTKTLRERVHLEAEPPRLPFPGRYWSAKARWDYTRETDVGADGATITQERPNEHVLVGKRVFTDRDVYNGGSTVHICAEVWTPAGKKERERFAVAHCFPIKDPARLTRRVLQSGALCARYDRALDEGRRNVCAHGIPHQVSGIPFVNLPLKVPPFVLIGEDSAALLDPGPGSPSGVTAVRLPRRTLGVACPPSTHVEATVFHRGSPVRVRAVSANGATADERTTPATPDVLHRVQLTGPEIIRLEFEAGDEAWLAELCANKRMLDVGKWKGVSTYYGGSFVLPLNEPDGKWAVVVVTQSVDNTPTNGDPLEAAAKLGGIVDSANVSETGECACEILFDHTFNVATPVVT